MSTLFTADLHFWHQNQADRRGFSSLDDMHTAFITDWNMRVKPQDHVWVLGDVSFAGFARTALVLKELLGTIHVVPGNHDSTSTMRRLQEARLITLELPLLMDYKIGVNHPDGQALVHRFNLCHFPLLVWNKGQHGSMMLHGHSHGSCRYPAPDMPIMDAGVDATIKLTGHWGPITLDEVVAHLGGRQHVAFDHHTPRSDNAPTMQG